MDSENKNNGTDNNITYSSAHIWLRYAEPAAIIAIITAAVFYVGWAYVDSYYARFGIQHEALDFPIHYYLVRSLWAAIIAIFLLPFMFHDARNSDKRRLSAFRGNTIFFALAGCFLYYTFEELPDTSGYFSLVGSVIITLFGISFSLRKISIAKIVVSAPFQARISMCVGILFFIVFASSVMGQIHAEGRIEGRTTNTISIEVATDGPLATAIDGKTLILILHKDNTYYLVEKQNPAPRHPTIYVIPDDQVSFAIQHKIK